MVRTGRPPATPTGSSAAVREVLDDPGTTSRDDVIQQDVADLHKLGYAQELFRSMGGFSNFAISFSIISILTGAVILYDYGLAWAGKAAVTHRLAVDHACSSCAIAASMAEIASAYPTAGGLYYWASRMKNKNWGWWTAWLNLIGQFAIVAGINYAAAAIPQRHDHRAGLTGLGSTNTTEIIPGVLNGQLVTMGILMLIQLVMNIRGINLVALAQPGQRLVAHRHRRGRRRADLPRRQARPVRPRPVRDPATRYGRQLGQQPRASST